MSTRKVLASCVAAIGFVVLAGVIWDRTTSSLHSNSRIVIEAPDVRPSDVVPANTSVEKDVEFKSIGESSSDTKKIIFPSGREIEVTFYPAERAVTSTDLPANIAASYLDLQRKAVEGDKFAALVAYRSVTICSQFPVRTKEELATAIDQANQTQTVSEMMDGRESLASAVPSAAENLQFLYDFCDGLGDDQRESAVYWLKQAADLGHPRSMKSYARNELGNSTEGRAYLRAAFDAGFYDSIGTLGLYLVEDERNRFIPSANENDYDDHSNPVLGYAYYYLYLKLAEADGKFTARAMQKLRAYKENEIDPHVTVTEREEAVLLAEEIMANHENCCSTLINW
jgi:hypothetical protein